MTVKDAFTIGFLTRCADEGLSPAQTVERVKSAMAMRKSAAGPLDWLKTLVISPAAHLGGAAINAAKPLALLGPPAAGAALGYGLAKTQDDHYSVDDARLDEQLAEYYRAMDQIARVHQGQ